MKFRIERTSLWDEEMSPCKEAVKAKVKRFDTRTFKSPEEFDAARFTDRRTGRVETWVGSGSEHKVLRGPRGGATGIQRRMEDETGWVLHLDSLHGLLAFREKYGDLVLSTETAEADDDDDYLPSIEIYDGYRE